MSLALMLVLQASLPAAPPAPAMTATDFDLAQFRPFGLGLPGRACDRGDPEAITVCGRRSRGAYPLDEMAREFEPGRLVAETRLFGNLIGDIHSEAREIGPGLTSNRVMARIRVPF